MKRFYALLLLMTPLFTLTGADITIENMEILSRGELQNEEFILTSRVTTDLKIEGGYKYGAELGLNFENNDVESLFIDPDDPVQRLNRTPLFTHANVQVRDIFGLPFTLLYFLGIQDPFLTGLDFRDEFGSPNIATNYRGYIYFPDGILYEGYHRITGTGLSLQTNRNWNDRFLGSLYLYQDGYLGEGKYSFDARGLFNGEKVKLELTAGTTFPVNTYNIYRAGLFFYANAGENGAFLTQIGIPYWNPQTDNEISTDMFYLLFEPRLRFGFLSIITTLFHHPRYYLNQPTGEEGALDINFNFLFGTPEKDPITGGLETNLKAVTINDPEVNIIVSPYVKLLSGGTFWDFKINVKAFPFDQNDLFDIFLGVRAEF